VRFNSYEFALFFAVLLALLPWFRGRRRHALLLVASYVFYGAWNVPFVSLLMFSTVLDFVCGARVYRAERPAVRRLWLAASVLGNMGPLFYFKYGNFFLENVAFVANVDPEPFYLDVVIPLGISFYTFQSLSYTIDMARRKHPPCERLLDFALFVTFFPQLVAGPIVRASEFLPQLRRTAPVTQAEILRGVELFLLGLFKKVVVADNVAILADRVFASPGDYSGAAVLAGTWAFWAQVYCDFSAYSTMAQGLGSMLGFQLPRNFDYPQLRHNPAQYRQTWHVTLGNWVTDYVYKPLGGSRVGDLRYAFNLLFTWALLGLWHGAAWNFVLWGAFNGVVLAVYAVGMRRKRWALPAFPGKRFCGWLLVVASNVASSIFFRAQSAGDAGVLLGKIASWAPGQEVASEWWAVLALLLAVHALSFWRYDENLLARLAWPGRIAVVTGTVLAIAVLAAGGRPFIYFQF
jgi:D-alanyl-lipoteichoic acid acyltransferase DltB (MBOAT superfamily)